MRACFGEFEEIASRETSVITFPQALGPLAIGRSSRFGLGLFVPVEAKAGAE